MIQIAEQTGGCMNEAKKKENFDQVCTQALPKSCARSTCLATHRISPAADESYHKITLTAKKKDLFVQTREGYYADK